MSNKDWVKFRHLLKSKRILEISEAIEVIMVDKTSTNASTVENLGMPDISATPFVAIRHAILYTAPM